jgi:hypothetical protein
MIRVCWILALGWAMGCGGGNGAEDDAGPLDDGTADAEDRGDPGEDPGDADEGAAEEVDEDAVPDAEDVLDESPGPDADGDGDADADGDATDFYAECDRDGDGYFSGSCWGDDCDDTRADVHPLAIENCTDGVDNDCNGFTDMADPFCDPTACTAPVPPTVVSGDGTYSADWRETGGSSDTFSLWTCSIMGPVFPSHQALFRLTLTETRDIAVGVTAGGPADVALVRGCDPDTAVVGDCIDDGTPTGTFRNLAPGTYLLVARFEEYRPGGDPTTADVTIAVALSAPTLPPPNDRCDAAVDISAGGTFSGTTLGARVDYEAPLCSSRAFADVAYRFTLTAASDVELEVDPAFNLVVAEDCGALRTTHHACRRGWASLGALPAGTYYVLVGAGSTTSAEGGPFELRVRVRTPAATPPGDTCADAVTIAPGETVAGDLFGGTNSQAAAMYTGSVCLSTMYDGETDVFYRFSLTAPRHLEIRFTSDTLAHTTVFTDCADIRASTVYCNAAPYSGTRSGLRARNVPAGDYLLRLQAASSSAGPPGPYSLLVGAYVPDATCTTPVGTVSGAGSTELTGTTEASFDDHRGACGSSTAGPDVVYIFDVAARSRVTIDASGATSVSAYLRATCESEASQLVCADPLVATTLDPGRYYLIVDAFPGPYSVWVDRIVL